MRGGEIALVDAGHGHVSIEAGAETCAAARCAVAMLRKALESPRAGIRAGVDRVLDARRVGR